MEFFIFICGIVILVLVFNLRCRVRKLEQFIKGGVFQRVPELNYQPQQQQSAIQHPVISQTDQTVVLPVPPVIPQEVGSVSNRCIEWLKEDWMLKLGAMLLCIGFGWLTTYAFLNNWIGPMGRIALGIIVGALFIILGWWRIEKHIHQGGIFLVLGSTIILLTIFAARAVYNFFTPVTALIVMFLSVTFVALASVKYNSRSLSLLSLILAGIAPLLTKAPATDHVGLFAYLFVITLGAIWIVVLTGQRGLTTAALIIISLYSAPHLVLPKLFPTVDVQKLLLFAYAFVVVFFLTNTIGILKLRDKKITHDLITSAGNGLFLLAWIMAAVKGEWKSLIISVWMVVFIVGAFLIFKITQRREPFYVYAGVGVAMLAAATAVELEGAALTIAYTIESGIVSLITYILLQDIRILKRTSFLLIGPIVLSFESISSGAWATKVIHEDFFVLLVLSLIMFGLGAFFLCRVKEIDNKESQKLGAILLIIGSVYAYILLWLSLHAGLQNNNTAVMIALMVYIIIGLIAYFYGLASERKGLRLYGGVLVGLVVARLFFIDIWVMKLAYRIVTFFIIGALLISTAFLGKNVKNNSNN